MIKEYLDKHGPSLSSKISEFLQSKGMSADAARQQISRAKGDIRRLDAVTLPNREKFLFLQKDYKSPDFKFNLATALIEKRTSYGLLLNAIRLRSGSLSLRHASIYSGLSVDKTKGHILVSTVVERLKKLELIVETEDVLHIVNEESDIEELKSIQIVESIVLDIYKNWLARTGFASFDKIQVRSEDLDQPKVGQFNWCLTAPTYISSVAIRKSKEVTPGFIVADIILGRKVTLEDAHFFTNKWDALINQRRKTPIQPFFIADSLSREALDLLRKKGCIIALPRNFFGEEAAELLRALISSMKNAALAVTKEPEKVFDLLKRLSKLEGASLNLRGVVFEFIIAHLHRVDGYGIDLRLIVHDRERNRAEIDIQAKKHKEVIFIECKGLASGNLVG
ncbi:MAG: hypothetical protein EAZ81_13355 [Verrucomicrobia bacterium]|nr:MAG: hypothetical protein EAZ81_13355 [Verrucomicrobiota bacterium]